METENIEDQTRAEEVDYLDLTVSTCLFREVVRKEEAEVAMLVLLVMLQILAEAVGEEEVVTEGEEEELGIRKITMTTRKRVRRKMETIFQRFRSGVRMTTKLKLAITTERIERQRRYRVA